MIVVFILSIFFPMYVGATYHIDRDAETRLLTAIINHPNQERTNLQLDGILRAVARARAIDMANNDYFAHVNPGGFGPNHLVLQAGFNLPREYRQSIEQNNIESIAGNPATAARTLQLLIDSDGHRPHILGQHPFFARQNKIGVGVIRCRGCKYISLWVVLIAESEDVSGEGRGTNSDALGTGPTVPGKRSPEVRISGPQLPE